MPVPIAQDDPILKELNEEQKAAVTWNKTPALIIIAGPGTGKTQCLAHRIAWLLHQNTLLGERIVATTFTNAAARELHERVERLTGRRAANVLTGTFHGIARRFLEQKVGEVNLIDPEENRTYLKDALARLFKERAKNINDTCRRLIVKAISAHKNHELAPDAPMLLPSGIRAGNTVSDALRGLLHGSDDMDEDDEGLGDARAGRVVENAEELFRDVYRAYQRRLEENGKRDLDDLLLETAAQLREDAAWRVQVAARIQHLLVDEYQDTNPVQRSLVKLLSSESKRITIVGDPDQSIYGWRGADPRIFHEFSLDFPECGTVVLTRNYRSVQPILDFAEAIIQQDPNHIPRALVAERGGGGAKPALIECQDEHDELRTVLGIVRDEARHRPLQGIALFYRTQRQGNPFEAAMLRNGIPFRRLDGHGILERKDAKNLLTYLRTAAFPEDDLALRNAMTLTDGLGDGTVQAVLDWAHGTGKDPARAVAELADPRVRSTLPRLTKSRVEALERFAQAFTPALQAAGTLDAGQALQLIREKFEYDAYIGAHLDRNKTSFERQEEFANRIEIVDQIIRVAGSGESARELLNRLALRSAAVQGKRQEDAVTLTTIHRAKGTEFLTVVIAGAERGQIPLLRSKHQDEECRLAFVACTRAKDTLYLTYTKQRKNYKGQAVPRDLSPLLENLPEELYRFSSVSGMRRYG